APRFNAIRREPEAERRSVHHRHDDALAKKRPPTQARLFISRSRPRLAVQSRPLDGYLQLCSPFFAFLPGKLSLAFLEGREFFFGRLQKTVPWCYCQLRVPCHRSPPVAPARYNPSTGTAERFGSAQSLVVHEWVV